MGYDPTAIPVGALATTSSSTAAGKKGSLLAYVREQKRRHNECIVLTRVGDFYEAFGVDALLLMEHAGLNAMAGKARAGCPIKNVRATLDALTSANYHVAVVEEASDTDSAAGTGSKTRLKTRMLGQIVSPANPTYLCMTWYC